MLSTTSRWFHRKDTGRACSARKYTTRMPSTKTKTATPAAPVKRGKDVTRTVRQVAHLGRLDAAKGKRLVVDLDAAAREALEGLQSTGYGESQVAVVRRALVDTALRQAKKKA